MTLECIQDALSIKKFGVFEASSVESLTLLFREPNNLDTAVTRAVTKVLKSFVLKNKFYAHMKLILEESGRCWLVMSTVGAAAPSLVWSANV